MELSKWWTKLSSLDCSGGDLATGLATHLTSINIPGSCLPVQLDYTLKCRDSKVEVKITNGAPETKAAEVFERRSARNVHLGVREDEEEFVEQSENITEDIMSSVSRAAGDDDVCSPPGVGPPSLVTSNLGEQRTETASSDIESARASEDIDVTLEDNCSAMHMLKTTSSFTQQKSKRDESSQTTFRHGTKPADSWVKQSVLSPSGSVYTYLREPVTQKANSEITSFVDLLSYIQSVPSEMDVSLQPLSRRLKGLVMTEDVNQGDIVYIEKGTAGVGHNPASLSTVVVSAENAARKSGYQKTDEFCKKCVSADCRLWDVVYPTANQQVTASTRRRAFTRAASDCAGQQPLRRCWGVWELPLKSIRGNAVKKNCVACYLNCYLVVIALRTVLKGETICLSEEDSMTDLTKLAVTSREDKGVEPTDVKPKISHFPSAPDSGACCTTLTTSASEDTAPMTPPSTKSETSFEEALKEVYTQFQACKQESAKQHLAKWPSNMSARHLSKVYRLFTKLLRLGKSVEPAESSLLNPLIYEMAEHIKTCRPRVQQLLDARSVDAFAREHGLFYALGDLQPLSRVAPRIHSMLSKLEQSKASSADDGCHGKNGIE